VNICPKVNCRRINEYQIKTNKENENEKMENGRFFKVGMVHVAVH